MSWWETLLDLFLKLRALEGSKQHLEVLGNDNRTRMATYKYTIWGWTEASDIDSATYVMI